MGTDEYYVEEGVEKLRYNHLNNSCYLGEAISLGDIKYSVESKKQSKSNEKFRTMKCPECGIDGTANFIGQTGKSNSRETRYFVRHENDHKCFMSKAENKLLVADRLVLIYGETKRDMCPKCGELGLYSSGKTGRYVDHGRINGKHMVCRLSR